MITNSKKLIVITGPTASGKTSLAIDLAKKLNTVIISADSRQFYKEMSIGTAKPSAQQLNEVQHYFINSHSIHQELNAGQYETEALPLIEKLFKTHPTLILAGGSGLYINAVCNGFDALPEADEVLRNKYQEILNTQGIGALQELLKEKDPKYYQQVDLNNPHRLMRALEVCELTGLPYSAQRKQNKKTRNFEIVKYAIDIPREQLYEQINKRVLDMMQEGLLEEVKTLLPFKHLNALNTVGYKELFEYLEGKCSLEQAVSQLQQNTRNFAKRQMTWFRKDTEIKWINKGDISLISL